MPGQPDYELAFIGKDKFSLKKLSGYSIQFDLSDNGEATAMTLMQPNGNFKATRKMTSPIAEKKK